MFERDEVPVSEVTIEDGGGEERGVSPRDAAAAAGAAIAANQQLTRMSDVFVTAVRVEVPRELAKIRAKVAEEARYLGDRASYSWPVKSKDKDGNLKMDQVVGVSQALAHAVARCYGNCAVTTAVTETADAFILTSSFIDRESGFVLQRPFRKSKTAPVPKNLDAQRAADYRFQDGCSRSARNVIVKALDRLCQEGLDVARAGMREGLEKWLTKEALKAGGLKPGQEDKLTQEHRDKALDIGRARALELLAKEAGVSEERVLAAFSYAGRGAITFNDLIDLQGKLAAIRNGEVEAHELFPELGGEKAADEKKEPTKSSMDKVAESLGNRQQPEPEKASTGEILPATEAARPLKPSEVGTLEAYAKEKGVSWGPVDARFGPFGAVVNDPAARLEAIRAFIDEQAGQTPKAMKGKK